MASAIVVSLGNNPKKTRRCARRLTSRCSSGIATPTLERFTELSDLDIVLVPIAGGSGAARCEIVRTALGACTRIVGVHAERADAVSRSSRTQTRVRGDTAHTFAEGMATAVSFDPTFGSSRRSLTMS